MSANWPKYRKLLGPHWDRRWSRNREGRASDALTPRGNTGVNCEHAGSTRKCVAKIRPESLSKDHKGAEPLRRTMVGCAVQGRHET